MQELATRTELTRKLTNGVGGVAAGLGLLIVAALSSSPVFWAAAGVCALIGLGLSFFSKTRKKAGFVMVGASALVGVAALVSNVLGWLVPVAGVGLIVIGGVSLFRFFRELKKRR